MMVKRYPMINIVIVNWLYCGIASVYNQGINYWPQVYLDECKYEEVENHGVLLLSDDEDDTVF